jgi:hypothetical protein
MGILLSDLIIIFPPVQCSGKRYDRMLSYRTFFVHPPVDELVKSIRMAKLKVPYTRRSGFSDPK